MIRLRFCTGSSAISALIRAQERVTMPFIPSHVEAVTPDGTYLGAHINGGVMDRPSDYDKATMTNEVFVNLDSDLSQTNAFYAYLRGKLGEPYDWKSIFNFIDPLHNLHDNQHVICSALQTLALRTCGWFPAPLPVPAHQISPRDLLLAIGGRVAIPGV